MSRTASIRIHRFAQQRDRPQNRTIPTQRDGSIVCTTSLFSAVPLIAAGTLKSTAGDRQDRRATTRALRDHRRQLRHRTTAQQAADLGTANAAAQDVQPEHRRHRPGDRRNWLPCRAATAFSMPSRSSSCSLPRTTCCEANGSPDAGIRRPVAHDDRVSRTTASNPHSGISTSSRPSPTGTGWPNTSNGPNPSRRNPGVRTGSPHRPGDVPVSDVAGSPCRTDLMSWMASTAPSRRRWVQPGLRLQRLDR